MMPVALLASTAVAGTDPAALAHFARCSSLTTDEKTYLNALISGLKSDGSWVLLDALIVPKGTEADSLLNLKSSSYDIANVGGCTFTASQGWTVDAVGSKYLNSNYTHGAVGTTSTENSSSAFTYRRNNIYAANVRDFGAVDASGKGTQNYMWTLNTIEFYSCNDSSPAGQSIAAGLAGFFGVMRTDATYVWEQVNGSTNNAAKAVGTSGMANVPVYIGALNNNGSVSNIATGNQYACWGAGAGMTKKQMIKLYNRIQAYMSSIGSAV